MPEKPTPFHIDGQIDIYSASQLRSTLEDYVRSHEEVVIDLSRVESVDVVGVQLLCSAEKTAAKSGKAFTLTNIPACLVELRKTLGLPESLWTNLSSDCRGLS
jgi:anti-sigma B factor antagonist